MVTRLISLDLPSAFWHFFAKDAEKLWKILDIQFAGLHIGIQRLYVFPGSLYRANRKKPLALCRIGGKCHFSGHEAAAGFKPSAKKPKFCSRFREKTRKKNCGNCENGIDRPRNAWIGGKNER